MPKTGVFIATLIVGALLGGCGATARPTLAGRFVKPGEPLMDYGGPEPAAAKSATRTAKPQAARRAPKPSPTLGSTVESSDPRLAAALLMELITPDARSHVRVAIEYKRLGVLDAAYERIERALAREPRLAEAHDMAARVWRDWGLPERGLGAAYRAVYFAPASASARNTLGTILDALGRSGDARTAFEAATALDPKAWWALNNLCYVDFREGRFDAALLRCEAALRIDPGSVAARNNLGLAFAAAGDLPRAAEAFRAAGDRAAAEYNLGIVYLADRQYASAADRFERAIEARPSFTAAKTRAHAARLRLLTGSE